VGLPRLRSLGVVAIVLSIAGIAHAETTGRYFERGHWHAVSSRADGSFAVERDDGTSFDAALGTDRVIISGAFDASSIDVVVDEVLSARANIVAVRSARGETTFALAERLASLVADGTLRAAMPDLALAHVRANIHVPPSDPDYTAQWFFQTIHMEDAWRHEDGDPSITIAVVDDGCDLTHPDLVPHLLPGYDAINDTPTPTYTPMTAGNNHGTSCAGLAAAATDNATDIAGTCAECSLRCVRLLGADGTSIPISDDVRAYDFVLMHADVAVVSNSWGFTASVPAPTALVDVINMVQTQGHGGLGAVVVFAAGNDGRVIGNDELQAIPGIVTVGAINQFLEAVSFTNTGDCLGIVSPAGTYTLDIVGAEGAGPGETTASFGGTSSACPIVAGVVGLMASRRPTMTAMDLRTALLGSARMAPFATPDAMGHDQTYGYGIVDPAAALARIDPNGVPDAGVDGGARDAGVDAGASPPSSGCGCRAGTSRSSWIGVVMLALLLMRRRSIVLLALLAGCASVPDVVASEPSYLRPTTTTESIATPGGAFRIHFTRTGTDAVPLADLDNNGTPDFVDYVATQYDMVLARYVAMGFRAPLADTALADNGGDGKFDVYLMQVGSSGEADGQFVREQCDASGCIGYMVEANTFSTGVYPSWQYGARLVAAHELFHAVQAAYADAISAQGSTLAESTAVWASYQYDSSLTDLMDFGASFLMRPDRALEIDPLGPVQQYAYGAAVVWEYYSTRFDPTLVVHFWNTLAITTSATAMNWVDVLDTVLMTDHGVGFRATYADFAEWLMFTGARYDATRGPPRGQLYAEVAATTITLPYTSLSTRIFPASAHYFLVNGDHVSVRLTNGDPSGIDVIAVGFNGNTFVRDARGVGQVDLMAAGADTVLIALANGARSGMSDAVSICIAGIASDCAMGGDAGVTSDAALSDASVAPAPAPSCGCRAGARPSTVWLGVLGLACLRRRRSRRR
jgi:subtilisin family serine protease